MWWKSSRGPPGSSILPQTWKQMEGSPGAPTAPITGIRLYRLAGPFSDRREKSSTFMQNQNNLIELPFHLVFRQIRSPTVCQILTTETPLRIRTWDRRLARSPKNEPSSLIHTRHRGIPHRPYRMQNTRPPLVLGATLPKPVDYKRIFRCFSFILIIYLYRLF